MYGPIFMEDVMEKKKNWFLRNDNWVKIYLAIMILVTVIISILAVKEIVDYVSGVKTDAVVIDVVNKRIKSGARKQSSYKATDLKLRYDVDLLITGKKSRKNLSEKYGEEKKKNSTKTTKPKPQYCSVKSKSQAPKRPYFWYFVGVSAIISAFLLIILAVI